MSRTIPFVAPAAHVTLRAHAPAPARVELQLRPAPGRALRTFLVIALFWGSIPLLVMVPPHYPWAFTSFCLGAYLAYRNWTGRYRIRSFAGVCPRCGAALSMGTTRTVDLPYTLTCFACHFEPILEVSLTVPGEVPWGRDLEHQSADCRGRWAERWLADERFLVCDTCHAGAPATAGNLYRAEAETEYGEILSRLTAEGRPLI